MRPMEVESRATTISSAESSTLRLSLQDSIRDARHLKMEEEEEELTSPEFGSSDMKYLLYEDERDFRVR